MAQGEELVKKYRTLISGHSLHYSKYYTQYTHTYIQYIHTHTHIHTYTHTLYTYTHTHTFNSHSHTQGPLCPTVTIYLVDKGC